MKQRLLLAALAVALVAGIVASERSRLEAPVSARPLLYLVADSQREMIALPAHFTRLSDDEEIRFGNSLATDYLSSAGPLSTADQRVAAYVQQVGDRVAAHAHRRLPYRFHYLADRGLINAFALPGGHIFVGAGLLERITSEDELAFVLGHEIEHVDHYHCAERLQADQALQHVPFGELFSIPMSLFEAGYSKEQELEADREGLQLTEQSGYSPQGALHLFHTFEQLDPERQSGGWSPLGELSEAADSVLVGYFRSHPPTDDRIAQVRAMIASEPGIASRPTRPLLVRSIFLTRQAEAQIAQEKYAPALSLANQALQLQPDYGPALAVQDEAEFGVGQLAVAQAAFQALVARDAVAAGAVEKWIDDGAARLIDRGAYPRAIAELQCVVRLDPAQLGPLQQLAWAEAGAGQTAEAAKTAETFVFGHPWVETNFVRVTLETAAHLSDAGRFLESARFAGLVVSLSPDNLPALRALAQAEFAAARFPAATASYGQLLRDHAIDLASFETLADALACVHPATAAQELRAAVAAAGPTLNTNGPGPTSADVLAETSGLALLADTGHSAPASTPAPAPLSAAALARLGWWSLRGGRLSDAERLLRNGLNVQPDSNALFNTLAWVELAQGHPRPQDFVAGPGNEDVVATPDVGAALALWEAHQTDAALDAWLGARLRAPQWQNPQWVGALYPAAIAAAARELEGAYQQRLAREKAAAAQAAQQAENN